MEDFKVSMEQVRNYIILINIVLGILFGTFPLLLGIKMNDRKNGVFGFVGAVIGGAILGVFLSYPIAVIFSWLIMKKPFATENASATVNENPIEPVIENTEIR